ncbi:PilZ domain-containing protein [Thiogranum longum]
MPSASENRKHTRLPIEVRAELILGGRRKTACVTRNLSFGGAYVLAETNPGAQPGESCDLLIVLQDAPDRLEIHLSCEVVHSADTGIGLRFLGIAADHYQDFRYLMINNSDDPDSLQEELLHNPGLEVNF